MKKLNALVFFMLCAQVGTAHAGFDTEEEPIDTSSKNDAKRLVREFGQLKILEIEQGVRAREKSCSIYQVEELINKAVRAAWQYEQEGGSVLYPRS